ncbi:putative pectinesterase/pectinesterase inhibitor 45 [Vicia villosa]|uniref:putative pectinesterase/pectinesterase inhibitor 45 n=1 Tax=Vicia villosa TaxID=3911 RepID=UPI00273AD35B|nr:putative pectinesterase/pectinesterase inhibitor 45 [Vicia villosa]
MAFQDFDLVSERRKTNAKSHLRKKIMVGVTSALLIACVVAAAAFVIVRHSGSDNNMKQVPTADSETAHIDKYSRLVKMLCSNSGYKEKCESTLTEALKKDPKLTEPKDLLMISMVLAENEINRAFNETANLKFANEEEKGAYEDCKLVFADSKEDMGFSMNEVGQVDVSKLAEKEAELNNWLSSVISNQQTCIDGFPEGEFKEKLKKIFTESRQLLSNTLAIISQISKIVNVFQGGLSGFKFPWGKSAAPTPAPLVARGAAAPAGSPGAAPFGAPVDYPIFEAPAGAPGAAPIDAATPPAWAAPVLEYVGTTEKPTPNVTVAQDGSGDFKTISEALAAIPLPYEGRYVVYVKEGVYDELVTVTKKMANLTMYGDGGLKSIITGNKNYVDGVRTFQTASFVALGEGFVGRDMGFRNTAGAIKHQAVAARVQADQAVFVNCNFEGYQDTLYAQTHRQFYRDCVISGTIDFIFGDASAVFQNCEMVIRKPLENQQNIVTAQGRIEKTENTGFVLQKCVIKGEDGLPPTTKNYIGRPWKEYSRTIIMESDIGGLIHPDGWLHWEGDFALKTLYYGEYNNVGAGANTNARIKWIGRKDINREEAMTYTVETFLQGTWINGTGVPANLGLYN